jgi:hypothetical protein
MLRNNWNMNMFFACYVASNILAKEIIETYKGEK